jgi:hypothetical protein
MATTTPSPPAFEMEPADFDRMLSDLCRDARKIPAKGARFRIRLTRQEFIVETVSVDAGGKPRVRVLQRMRIGKMKTTKARPKYDDLREQFATAAAKHHVASETVAANRENNAAVIAHYWKQAPAE